MTAYLKYIAKALVALGGAGAQLVVVMASDSAAGSTITLAEWVTVGVATLAALGVYGVSNGPRPGAADDGTDDGYLSALAEQQGRHEAP